MTLKYERSRVAAQKLVEEETVKRTGKEEEDEAKYSRLQRSVRSKASFSSGEGLNVSHRLNGSIRQK